MALKSSCQQIRDEVSLLSRSLVPVVFCSPICYLMGRDVVPSNLYHKPTVIHLFYYKRCTAENTKASRILRVVRLTVAEVLRQNQSISYSLDAGNGKEAYVLVMGIIALTAKDEMQCWKKLLHDLESAAKEPGPSTDVEEDDYWEKATQAIDYHYSEGNPIGAFLWMLSAEAQMRCDDNQHKPYQCSRAQPDELNILVGLAIHRGYQFCILWQLSRVSSKFRDIAHVLPVVVAHLDSRYPFVRECLSTSMSSDCHHMYS